jgi:hypothetical protein
MARVSKKDLKQELRETFRVENTKKDSEEVKVVFDGRQYGIRIPKKMVDALNLDAKHDSFVFEIEIPRRHTKEKPKLTGRLKRGSK